MPDTRYQIFFDERISDISYLLSYHSIRSNNDI